MNNKTLPIILTLSILLLIGVFVYPYISKPSQKSIPVSYTCNAQKNITAIYTISDTKNIHRINPDKIPTPEGSVTLTTSDGRTLVLPQTISASGVRYANTDESIVFWNKGAGAIFTENNIETYTGCIALAQKTELLSLGYGNVQDGFSLRYPKGYSVNPSYTYQARGPGKNIAGIKFTIPVTYATGTNLSSDSYISIEKLPENKTCSADQFLDEGNVSSTLQGNDTVYSVASSTGAGAGNRYEEIVYAIPGSSPCLAVRYFIHYGVIENYPEGVVKAFNKTMLIEEFDAIRRTLIIAR